MVSSFANISKGKICKCDKSPKLYVLWGKNLTDTKLFLIKTILLTWTKFLNFIIL